MRTGLRTRRVLRAGSPVQRAMLCVAVAGLHGVCACAPPIQAARVDPAAPAMPRELEAQRRVAAARCSTAWGFAAPGLGQLCLGKQREAAWLLALTGIEAGAAVAAAATVAVADGDSVVEHPAIALPLIALQDLWVYGIVATVMDGQRAQKLPLVPQDSLGELAVAPFNPRVVAQPQVWLGIAGTLAAGIAVSALVDEELTTRHLGDDANVFGAELAPGLGYPLAGASFGALFTHVAIAEESLFRGIVQSGIARKHGETRGWVYGSLVFGAAHALNALALEGDERRDYLALGLPYITVVGSYLGLSYRWSDYSLAPPVAIHFWYDFLLSAAFFAMNPQDSTLAARIALPF